MLSDEIFYLWGLKLALPKWPRNDEVFPIPEPLDKVSVGFFTAKNLSRSCLPRCNWDLKKFIQSSKSFIMKTMLWLKMPTSGIFCCITKDDSSAIPFAKILAKQLSEKGY